MARRHTVDAHPPAAAPGFGAQAALARLDFPSDLDILPLVDAVSQHFAGTTGLDEDSAHWVTVATREAVVNAIVHGNRSDSSKRVYLVFEAVGDAGQPALSIRVRDEGAGFDPERVPDPLAEQNLRRSGGRGILLMRSMLDDLRFHRHQEGATEVVLVKRAAAAPAP